MRGSAGAVVVAVTRHTTDKEVLLFHQCTLRGFHFDDAPAAEGGPLVGIRHTKQWIDTIHLEGLTRNCAAWRQQPGQGSLVCRIEGDATTVMAAALNWGTTRILSREETTHALSE